MANIKTHLNNIKNALFGNEVRGSIHDGIDAINKEVESTTNRQKHLETTFDQLTINAGNSNAEIVDARVGENGKSYVKLGDRLDEVDSQVDLNGNTIETKAKNIRDNMSNLVEVNKSTFIAHDVDDPIFTRDSELTYNDELLSVNEPRFSEEGLLIDSKLNENLKIPTRNLFSNKEGTIEVTLIPTLIENYTNMFYMKLNDGRFIIYIDENGKVSFGIGPVGESITTKESLASVGKQIHIVANWSLEHKKYDLMVNNVHIGSHDYSYEEEFPEDMNVLKDGECVFVDLKISNIYKTGLQVIV